MSFNKVDTLPKEVAERIHLRRSERASWADIEAEFNISSPRAKTLLTKHGLDHSPLGDLRKAAARYGNAKDMWERPCIRCGKCEPRARGLFRCKSCRQEGRDHFNAADSMYATGGGA